MRMPTALMTTDREDGHETELRTILMIIMAATTELDYGLEMGHWMERFTMVEINQEFGLEMDYGLEMKPRPETEHWMEQYLVRIMTVEIV